MLCKSACMTSSFHRLPEGRCVVCNDCSDYVNGVRMDVIRQAAPLAWRVCDGAALHDELPKESARRTG